MRLADFLASRFSQGLLYSDAVQLCLAIYCSAGILPAELIDEELSMDRIAEAFSEISTRGLIREYRSNVAATYGANYHSVEAKGHWIEVQASILKMKLTYDLDRAKALLR